MFLSSSSLFQCVVPSNPFQINCKKSHNESNKYSQTHTHKHLHSKKNIHIKAICVVHLCIASVGKGDRNWLKQMVSACPLYSCYFMCVCVFVEHAWDANVFVCICVEMSSTSPRKILLNVQSTQIDTKGPEINSTFFFFCFS